MFDAVFSICVIEHLADRREQKEFLKKMGSCVKPGGRLLLTFGYGPAGTRNPYRSEEEVQREIYDTLTGFTPLAPFRFSGKWTIADQHTWGFIAADKKANEEESL